MLVHNTCFEIQKNSIANKRTDILRENKIRGAAYEKEKFAEFSSKYSHAETQVTIKTDSGRKTRVDAIGYDENGNIVINEFKSSATARLRTNQRDAFEEIRQSGGVVVGRGKGVFSRNVLTSAGTDVKVIRP